jgi:hypothetical protein
MAHRVHLLFVLFMLFLAPPVGAQDKPPAKPGDARRAALIKAGYTAIPLTLDPLGTIFVVDGAVGPKKVKFDLDSGSIGDTILDLKLAKRLKLKLGEEAAAVGLDGALGGRRIDAFDLKIGPYDTRKDWPNLPALAVDLSDQSGRSRSGVLGVGVLDQWGAVIDYPARAMYLRPPLNAAWPRLAGDWDVTSWLEDGAARKLDPKSTPTFKFADRRLKLTDRGKTTDYAIQFAPSVANTGDLLLLFDPKDEGKTDFDYDGGGLIKIKDGVMTLCLLLDSDKGDLPKTFAAPKGSGHKLLQLKLATPAAQKPPADPLRELLLKDGFTAVPLDRDNGVRIAAARVGRHDLRVLVDTGASISMFDTAGLGKWGAVRVGAQEVHGLAGKAKGEHVNFRGLTLGGYDTRRAWGVVYGTGVDLAGLNKAFVEQKLRPIQGLLGNLDLLNGSAVIDFATNTLYLRPVKETLGPQLEGKWVGMRYEFDGKKGRYAPGDAAVEFRGGRVRFIDRGKATEWMYHLEDEGEKYRLGLFDANADQLADGFRYAGAGLFKLTGDTLTMVMLRRGARTVEELTEVAAPKGSGLLLTEYERAK